MLLSAREAGPVRQKDLEPSQSPFSMWLMKINFRGEGGAETPRKGARAWADKKVLSHVVKALSAIISLVPEKKVLCAEQLIIE